MPGNDDGERSVLTAAFGRLFSWRKRMAPTPEQTELGYVVEMGLKIHVRLARVNGADHEPRHAGRLFDRRIARAVGDDRARGLARAVELGRGDLRAIPHAVVAEFGLLRRRSHSLSP